MSANRAPNPLRCSEANKARRGSAYGTKELTTSLSVSRAVSPQRGGGTQGGRLAREAGLSILTGGGALTAPTRPALIAPISLCAGFTSPLSQYARPLASRGGAGESALPTASGKSGKRLRMRELGPPAGQSRYQHSGTPANRHSTRLLRR
eukprot:scaffold43375_cov63-Phaeocystis_antarctica.AAC.1